MLKLVDNVEVDHITMNLNNASTLITIHIVELGVSVVSNDMQSACLEKER